MHGGEIGRRRLLALTASATASAVLGSRAAAQTYPFGPVRIIVGFPPGGGADIAARLIAQSLSERLGQPFVVENRPGAATNIGTEAVVRASADGHTLLLTTSTNIVNAARADHPRFDFARDIEAVGGIVRSPLVLEVTPALPVQTVPELVAYAAANPGKINIGHFGNGTIGHLCTELFRKTTKLDGLLVPYNGSAPMVVDLLAGRVQVAFDNLPGSIEHIRSKQLRPLAVTTPTRSAFLPDVPALREHLTGFEVGLVSGLGAPRGTPAEIIRKLNSEINAALEDPKMKARLADLGGEPLPGSSADYAKFIADEIARWRSVAAAITEKVN